MPNPASALRNLDTVVQQPAVEDGYVSTVQPAPTAFTDKLYVIVPEYSTTVPLGPCEWGAIHGSTLPAQGAAVQVAFGSGEIPIPRIVWWEGAQGNGVGSWQALSGLNASLEADATYQTPEVRIEQSGARAYLKGAYIVKVGKTFAVGTVFATLPSGCRPPKESRFPSIVPPLSAEHGGGAITIKTNGEMALSFFTATELKEGAVIFLDGITVNLS